MRIFKKGFFLTLSLTLLSSVSLFGQIDAQFSHYAFNTLYTNPAYSGLESMARINLIHRSQWLGYETTVGDEGGAPTTQLLSGNIPLAIFGAESFNSGAGLYVVNDKLGPRKDMTIKASFAYQIGLDNISRIFQGTKLSIGARAGFYSQSIDGSLLRANQLNDPIVDEIGTSKVAQAKPDFGFGMIYQSRNKNYLGISFDHIGKSDFNFGSSNIVDSKLVSHFYIVGGYNIQLTQAITLQPNGIIQTDFSETTYHFGLLAHYEARQEFWGGLTFRQSAGAKEFSDGGNKYSLDDVVFMAGIGLMKDKTGKYNKLRVSYAFDLVTSGVKAKNPTSHEIMVSYVFPVDGFLAKPIQYSPRYKHETEKKVE